MSHPTTIRHAFWDALRTLYRGLRRAVGSGTEHGGPAVVVEGSTDEVTAALGRRYFAPNWEFSYHERGEDLNLARVEYDRARVSDHTYEWWQTHVRGWEQGDGRLRLRAHWELEPTEYDQDHIDGIGLDIDRGIEGTEVALETAGLATAVHEDVPPGGYQ